MSDRLSGKTIVVVGPGGNLGPSWVTTLLRQGARVWGLGLGVFSDSSLSALRDEWGEMLILSEINLLLEPNGAPILDWWPEDPLGLEISGVVFNAGLDSLPGTGKISLASYSRSEWSEVFGVNVFGVVDLLNSLERHFTDSCSIVMLGSLYGIVSPNPDLYSHFNDGEGSTKHPAYGASKAAIVSLARQYATHWAPRGVRVNVLTLGGVGAGQDAYFVQKYSAASPMGRMLEKEEALGPMVFLLSDESRGVTGHNLVVDGGFTAW